MTLFASTKEQQTFSGSHDIHIFIVYVNYFLLMDMVSCNYLFFFEEKFQVNLRQNGFQLLWLISKTCPQFLKVVWMDFDNELPCEYISCSVEREQLVRLRSDDIPRPPPPHDYPYYWPVHIGSQAHTTDQLILNQKSSENKVKITNSKNLPKLQLL